MVKNICDLGYAAEEQYRRNSELMRRMLEAKEGVVTGPLFSKLCNKFLTFLNCLSKQFRFETDFFWFQL